MAFKFPECESCYFHNLEPAICEECDDGSEYEPEDGEEGAGDALRHMDAIYELRRIEFHPRRSAGDVLQVEELEAA